MAIVKLKHKGSSTMLVKHKPKTMSSLEVAELTGKRHNNVMRDIRSLLKDLQNSNLSFVCESATYKSESGQDYPCYHLDKDTTLTLLLGYDPVARMKVVKRWTQLEAEKVRDEIDPDRLIAKFKEAHRRQGKSEAWINARLRSIASRHDFTDCLKDHGVNGFGYGLCTNAIYTPLFGGGVKAVRRKLNIGESESVRDNMSSLHLTSVQFAEELAKEYIEINDIFGNKRCERASLSSATIVADAIKKNRQNN